jgi:hypothetical protein
VESYKREFNCCGDWGVIYHFQFFGDGVEQRDSSEIETRRDETHRRSLAVADHLTQHLRTSSEHVETNRQISCSFATPNTYYSGTSCNPNIGVSMVKGISTSPKGGM